MEFVETTAPRRSEQGPPFCWTGTGVLMDKGINIAYPGNSGLDFGPLSLFHKNLEDCFPKYDQIVINNSLGEGQDFN